jgi:hypothetical protein
MRGSEVRVILRQGSAGTELFEEVKKWYGRFGRRQMRLL